MCFFDCEWCVVFRYVGRSLGKVVSGVFFVRNCLVSGVSVFFTQCLYLWGVVFGFWFFVYGGE